MVARGVVSLLAALAKLWGDARELLVPANWGQMPEILKKIREDLDSLWAEFGGRDNALKMIANAKPEDFDEAAAMVGGVCFAPSDKAGFEFDGKFIKWLITYGPAIYNIFATFFGWPPLPPIPVPNNDDEDPAPVPVGP